MKDELTNPALVFCDADSVDVALSALQGEAPLTVLHFYRSEIESGLTGAAMSRLLAIGDSPDAVRQLANSAVIEVLGYDADPRELYEIPECQHFFRSLAGQWGGWLYFLEKDGGTLPLFLSLLIDVDVERRSDGVVSCRMRDPRQLREVLQRQFRGMNAIYVHYGLGTEACIAMTDKVMAAADRMFVPIDGGARR